MVHLQRLLILFGLSFYLIILLFMFKGSILYTFIICNRLFPSHLIVLVIVCHVALYRGRMIDFVSFTFLDAHTIDHDQNIFAADIYSIR